MTASGEAISGPDRAIGPLSEANDDAAARLLARCAPDGGVAGAVAMLSELRSSVGVELRGLEVGGELLGLSATRRQGMTFELMLLIVDPLARRQGHGKELLVEALVRAGRRPTVTEARAEDLPFYQATRFKPVARRKQPDGTFRFRLGWHPPGQRDPVGPQV